MLSFFPRGVLDEILNLIESVSEEFPSYSCEHKNMFETGVVRANERQVSRQNKDVLSIFYNLKVYCEFSLESPHRGDAKYTQYTIFNTKKRNHPKLSLVCSCGFFRRDSRTSSKQLW